MQPSIESTASAEPREAYRRRAKLMVSAAPDATGRLAPIIGLFARSPNDGKRSRDGADHRVVDIPQCRVLRPALATVAAGLRSLLAVAPTGSGACLLPEAMGGRLSAFDLREVDRDGEGGVLATLVLSAGDPPPSSELACAADAVRGVSQDVCGVAVNFRMPKSPQVLGGTTRVLWGAEVARDAAGTAFQFASYGSFIQSHRGQADRIAMILSDAFAQIGLTSAGNAAARPASRTRVLDLYGGSGALSLPWAKSGASVTLVESFRPAADAAARAAREQGFANFDVRVGDAARVLGALQREGTTFDAVITNPPRRGMAPEVRTAVAALRPRAIAYVSCDPDTFARDLAHFARLGYGAPRVHPVDMIPLTDQVETAALLVPIEAPPRAVAYEDADLAVVEKPAHMSAEPLRGDLRLAWSASEDTSGFAVWSQTAPLLHAPRQVCLVLARGLMAARGTIGKKSTYERLAKLNGHSLLRVRMESGNASDVRRALARSGHAVVGDRRNGHEPTNRHFEERYLLDRPFWHCVELSFAHPRTRSTIRAQAEVPGEIGMVLTRLGPLALDVAKRVM